MSRIYGFEHTKKCAYACICVYVCDEREKYQRIHCILVLIAFVVGMSFLILVGYWCLNDDSRASIGLPLLLILIVLLLLQLLLLVSFLMQLSLAFVCLWLMCELQVAKQCDRSKNELLCLTSIILPAKKSTSFHTLFAPFILKIKCLNVCLCAPGWYMNKCYNTQTHTQTQALPTQQIC